jgi:acetyl-CoA C-acetyltransferase
MSRIPFGARMSGDSGHAAPAGHADQYGSSDQLHGAEQIASHWGISRADCDEFGLRSHQRAAAAWADGRATGGVVEIAAADDLTHDGSHAGIVTTRRVTIDDGLRVSTLEDFAHLEPVVGANGVHTTGTMAQISAGAAAVLLAERNAANELGLSTRARILDTCLVGADPWLVLTGPIAATRALLERNRMTISDISVVEINEAFASVVLAWERELQPPGLDRVNPNGGALAHGNPLGAIGPGLIAKAMHELEQVDGDLALVTMGCGGGLGTGMLLERIA